MSVYKRGNVYWVDLYVGAGRKRKRVSTHTGDLTKARMIEQSIIGVNRNILTRNRAIAIIDNVLPEEQHGLKLKDALEFYNNSLRDENWIISKGVLNHRLCTISKFVAWAEHETRILYVEEVTAATAFEFSKVLSKTGISPRTHNAYIQDLGTTWKLLQRHNYAKENPWPLVKVQRKFDEEKTGRAFTPEEIARLFAVGRKVGNDWETAMLIGLYTGLRQGDAVSLKWSDMDFEKGVINYRPSKTRRHNITVTIPLHRTLSDWLSAHRNGSEYITPSRVGKVGKVSLPDGDLTFNQILTKADVVPTSARDKLSFHCFRHTFVSQLAEAGIAEDVRMRLAGHTSATNHAIYTHDDKSARAAIDALPTFAA